MDDNRIIKTEYSEVMQKSYIDYAMSVIIARALPDVRDGLKPVQRRTLYDMHELGIRYDRPYRKSARIVGDTMGKYHPHGDSSIYDALVVMTQEFKKGMPLVDGHGNFGNIEGDGAAAMRYTEARLQKVTQEAFLADLDKNVVDFIPNFDETEKEPSVLPVKIPNLLVNGSEGIAVGMATSIPPHNLAEVIDAAKAYMKNPDITTKELLRYVKGPDFPTGGFALCFYSGFGYCFFLLGLCAISLYRFLYHAFHLHLYRFLHRTFHLHFMLCLYVNLLNSALFLHSVLYLYTRFSYYTFLSRLYSILTYQIFTPFFPPILPTAALS